MPFERGACPGRQSNRRHIYEAALERLRVQGLVYACECSRSDIETTSEAAFDERRYPGTCARKGLADREGLSLRVRLVPSVERFDDLRHGPTEQRPSDQCGDLLIRDRDGNWTYQFSAAVDDHDQGVSLVIRGDDLLASTGRQMQLARLLGRVSPPRFLHHPLIMKTPTQKLSKSDGDTGVGQLRVKGRSASDVIGDAAAVAGLIESPRPLRVCELADLRSLQALAGRTSSSARRTL